MSHLNPEFDRSLLKDVPTLALMEELSERKQCAQVARDAFFKEKWPKNWLYKWFFVPNFCVALLLVYLTQYAGLPYIQRVDFIYQIPLGVLLLGIVFILSLSPTIFAIEKEGQVERDFRKEHPEHWDAMYG